MKNERGTWPVILACGLAGLIPEGSSSVQNQALDTVVLEFKAEFTTAQLMISVGKLLFASFVMAAGILGDRYGHKRLLIAGALGMAVSAGLSAASISPFMLILARGLDGIFSAFVTTLALASLTAHFAKKERFYIIALYIWIMGLGSLSIPYLSALLIESFSWRVVYMVPAAHAILAALIVGYWVPAGEIGRYKQLDWTGIFQMTIAFLAMIFSLIESGRHGWGHWRVAGSFAAGVIILLLFIQRQLRISNPLLDLKLFRSPGFSLAVVVGMIVPFVSAGLSLPLLYYFRSIQLDSPATAALKVMPIALAFAFFAPVAGKLGLKMESRKIMGAGLLLMAIGSFGLSMITPDTSYITLVIPMILVGIGSAFAITQRTGIILGAAPRQETGEASGINTISAKLGSALGSAVLTTLFFKYVTVDYSKRMEYAAMPLEQLRKITQEWRQAVHGSVSFESVRLPEDLIRHMEAAFRHAFSAGLAHAEFLAAILLFAFSVLVWFRLKENRQSGDLAD